MHIPSRPVPASLPTPFHVAVIMDGNGRWAQSRGLPRVAGHKQGVEAVRAVVEAAPALGITHLTLFGFSSENWRRPEAEVSALMGLLRLYLKTEIRRLAEAGVCLRFIGERARLSPDIAAGLARAEADTAANGALTLTIALSYGGRADIAGAARRLAEQARAGTLDPAAIDETLLGAHLDTGGLPDPDLMIRTSGEQRLSNFLLWQGAYTELVFTDTLWPDFSAAHLADCVSIFARRDRRYGALAAKG